MLEKTEKTEFLERDIGVGQGEGRGQTGCLARRIFGLHVFFTL